MSDSTSDSADEGPALVSNSTMDAIVAATLLVVGALVVYQAYKLGSSWTDDGPGSGYFPFYIGLIICISSLGILYQALLSPARDKGGFVNRVQLGRVLQVLLPALVYVGAIYLLGIYVASAIYIAGFMIFLGEYPRLKSVLLGVAISAFFFCLFEVWFKVPLFKGKFAPLSFLGF